MIKDLNILYTCDDAYLPLTSISMASCIRNNPKSDITFYLATEQDDKTENFKKLIKFYKTNKNIKIKHLDTKKYDYLLKEKDFDTWGSRSYYVYWKLFAYDELDVDKLWYLDSDAICLREIEYPKLNKDKAIGACLDSAHSYFNKVAHIDESYYFFNTGSLFIDVKKWKKFGCTSKVVDYIKTMNFKPLMCDQDILAAALQEEIELINPKYNYLACYEYYGVRNTFEMYSLNKRPYYSIEEIEASYKNTIFYHCLGGVFGRPWQVGNYSPIKEEFEKYRAVSCWSNYSTSFNKSLLFKIESFLEFLPKPIYNKIHNLAQRLYLKTMVKK